eukprot:TRINITY_DN29265_c0_g1_i1.p1 TRINITY_DN29265_c0_g1~~TRINITY_DN29265_c0_g1_i1.p1  ORF type:complete len:533 (+),score=63.11 TRINITY_DN29265_c0_g1_i1:87-1685(+)
MSAIAHHEFGSRVKDAPPLFSDLSSLRETEGEIGIGGHTSKMQIAIVGGSIGGLAAAALLQKQGHVVTIFERSNRLDSQAGGGIVMQRPLENLFSMLFPGMTVGGTAINSDSGTDTSTTTESGAALLEHVYIPVRGRQFLTRSGDVENQVQSPQEMTSWSALWSVLQGQIAEEKYVTGTSVDRIYAASTPGGEQGNNKLFLDTCRSSADARSTHSTQDASTKDTKGPFDMVLGCDGQGSAVRQQMLQSEHRMAPILYAGYVAWRGVVPESELSAELLATFDEWFTFFHADSTHILLYIIPMVAKDPSSGKQVRVTRALNWVWYWNLSESELEDLLVPALAEGGDKNATCSNSTSASSSVEWQEDKPSTAAENTHEYSSRSFFSVPPGRLPEKAIRKLHDLAKKELPPNARDLVINYTKKPFLQPIYDFATPQAVFYHLGESSKTAGAETKNLVAPVVLLGDAQCVLRPHTAYGTAKAVEDAISLAKTLEQTENNTLAQDLNRWEELALMRNAHMSDYGKRLGASQKAQAQAK